MRVKRLELSLPKDRDFKSLASAIPPYPQIKFTCYRTSEIININAISFFSSAKKRFIVTKKQHRRDRIRTCDFLDPNQAVYQTDLHAAVRDDESRSFQKRINATMPNI